MHSLISLKPFLPSKLNVVKEEYPCSIGLRKNYLENSCIDASKQVKAPDCD